MLLLPARARHVCNAGGVAVSPSSLFLFLFNLYIFSFYGQVLFICNPVPARPLHGFNSTKDDDLDKSAVIHLSTQFLYLCLVVLQLRETTFPFSLFQQYL
jgi:hypothetical protein